MSPVPTRDNTKRATVSKLAMPLHTVDPVTITTVSMEKKAANAELFDSITPHVSLARFLKEMAK